ncbi:transposase [Deefgea sp. CFH1-16]|nr:transposase [Deefgea sp. CFH1-16]
MEAQALVAQLQAQIQTLELKNQKLILEQAHLKRIKFGVKSEALTIEQKQLFDDDGEQDLAAIAAELDEAPVREDAPVSRLKPRPRAGRQPLLEHQERVEVRHEPDQCTCGQCQSKQVKIAEDVSEQLDIEPVRFFVVRHIRPQYACRQCETIIAAPVLAAVIDGGMATPGLLAWVAISKYLDHLPLYRVEQIAARQQVILARSTLSEWIGRIGVALQPLAVIVKLVVASIVKSYAIFCAIFSLTSKTSVSDSFSGFKCTIFVLSQLRVLLDHRRGFLARAAS